jgi:6-phosphogluconolactonase
MSYWGRIIGLGCMAVFCAACSPGGSDGDVDPPPTVYKNYLYVAAGTTAYSIDAATGALTRVTFPQGTWGGADCLAIHPSGKFLISGNMSWHQFGVFTIDAATGALTLMDGSPYDVSGGPRAIGLINSGEIMVVANYALPGLVTVCTINRVSGKITEVYDYIEYSGAVFRARSLAVHPLDKFVYVACEGLSPGVGEEIQAFAVINAEIGEMAPIHDMPRLAAGSAPSFVTVDPTGKFLYLTNQGLDTVSAFAIDATTGALTEVAGSPFGTLGDRPTCVMVDPSGKFAYVANEESDTVSAFSVDPTTGALTSLVPSPTFPTGRNPCSIAFDPSGKFVYVCNRSTHFIGDHVFISTFSMDPGTGALTALAGSPRSTGGGSWGNPSFSMAVIRIAYKGS